MAKITLSIGDTVLREIVLSKERLTIGRRPHNDIVIDDLAISGEHAVIVTRNNDSFLEDLNSTNGTQVNGQPVRKHFLQDADVIELARFRAIYSGAHEGNGESCMATGTPEPKPFVPSLPLLRVLNGPSAGKEITLDRVLTTLGRPDVQIAVVTQRDQSYFLAHVEGASYPVLNGHPIGSDPHPLCHGDVIELAETRMKFFLP